MQHWDIRKQNAEHHYASSVPFHALPELNRILGGYVHIEKRGYMGAHADILSQLLGRAPRQDVNVKDQGNDAHT